jgi:hypothetical protein
MTTVPSPLIQNCRSEKVGNVVAKQNTEALNLLVFRINTDLMIIGHSSAYILN